MSEDGRGLPLSRRAVVRAHSALLLGFAGCSGVRSGKRRTRTPPETATRTPSDTAPPPPSETPADDGGVFETEFGAEAVPSSEYLAEAGEDGSSAIRTMIEDVAASGPARIRWDSGTVRVENTISPRTDGTTVVIDGDKEAEIDGSGFDGHIVDLGSAPDVSMRRMTITGSPGEQAARSLIPGEGATLEDIVLGGGAGGLEIKNSDVRASNVEAYGHRDEKNGYAAGIHAAGEIENVHVSDIDVHGCDRGVEIDDGPSNWTVEHGTIRDIDNLQAEDPGVPFALDCHVHAGEPAIEGGTFRDLIVERCQMGLTISEHEEGSVSGVVAENIQVRHVRSESYILCEGDCKIIDPTVVAGEEGADIGILVRGGTVEVRGGHVSGPNWFGLTTREGKRTGLERVLIDGLTVDGKGFTNHLFDLASPRGNITIRGVTLENPGQSAIRSEKGSLGGSKWGVAISDSTIGGDIRIDESGNEPVLIENSTITGEITVPEGSRLVDVRRRS